VSTAVPLPLASLPSAAAPEFGVASSGSQLAISLDPSPHSARVHKAVGTLVGTLGCRGAARCRGGRGAPCICEHLTVNTPLTPSRPVLWASAVDGRLARLSAYGPRESAREERSNALLPTSDRCGDGRQHHFAARRTCENHALAGPLGCALFSTCLPTSPIASV
jgi:hypothetical protein